MITAGDEAIFGGELCENIFFCDGERRRPTEHAFDTILKLDSECMLKTFLLIVIVTVFPAADCRRGVPEEATMSIPLVAQNLRRRSVPRS